MSDLQQKHLLSIPSLPLSSAVEAVGTTRAAILISGSGTGAAVTPVHAVAAATQREAHVEGEVDLATAAARRLVALPGATERTEAVHSDVGRVLTRTSAAH